MRVLQKGLSLVELMVALLIGVILTSGVISVYITSKASYSMNTGLGQVQEEGRFALQKMQPLLVLAGNLGCYSPPQGVPITSFLNSSDPVYNMRLPVYGFEYNGNSVDTGTGKYYSDSSAPGFSNSPTVDNTASDWSPTLSTKVAGVLSGYAVRYSDVLLIHEQIGNPPPAAINNDTGGDAGTWTYSSTNPPAMAAGQILVASNCNKEITTLVASAVDTTAHTISHSLTYAGTPGNSLAPGGLTGSWKQFTVTAGGGLVGPAQTYIFFVGKSAIDNGTSLFEVSLDTSGANAGQLGAPVEIVPGVENMQVLYGVDTDNDKVPNIYKTASAVDALAKNKKCAVNTTVAFDDCPWQDVVSVRIALIVHSDPNSVDAAPASTTAFHMLGTSYTDSFSYRPYPDRRMRRYFAQTFSLRNSLP
jgi:type IV pilus assembly protein PilW